MDAEIGFLHQHVGRFLNPDAVSLRQLLAKNAVKGTVDEHHLHLTQQVVGGGHLVPKAMAAGPSTALAGNTLLARTWLSVSVSTRRLRPLTNLPVSNRTVAPVAVAAFLTLCESRITAVGQAFFRPVPGCLRAGRC